MDSGTVGLFIRMQSILSDHPDPIRSMVAIAKWDMIICLAGFVVLSLALAMYACYHVA